jgi:hypothetical protein
MGWLSRTLRPADDPTAAADGRSGEGAGAPDATPTAHEAPAGRFGPLVSVTRLDGAPQELEWQLPLNGELYRLMAGSDRPDYSLMVLERPLHFYPKDGFDLGRVEADQRVLDRRGRQMVRVHALLLCARFVGQQLHPGMRDLAVNLAYVIDNTLARDATVDFGKIEFAAVGYLSEGVAPWTAPTVPGAPEPVDEPVDEPANKTVDQPVDQPVDETAEVVADATVDAGSGPEAVRAPVDGADGASDHALVVARRARDVLVRGIEAHRGRPVERLSALLTLDGDHRLTGLSGNADGEPPAPTPETFTELGEVLGALADDPGSAGVRTMRFRPGDGEDAVEVTRD